MDKFYRIIKAVGIVLALFTVAAVLMLLMAWMKGLFVVLVFFFGMVWLVYSALERRDWHKNWRQRNADWRNYK